MAFNKKAAEAGWFYHAPAPPSHGPAQGVPPASQIPMLSALPSDNLPAPEHQGRKIYDHDSKYVQLAKRGGQEDLLAFKYLGKKSESPKGYPRVDWFYLEDIRAEEAQKYENEQKKNYEFMLPEYMVHTDYATAMEGIPADDYSPQRQPYAFDQNSAFEREVDPTDKNIKLPNVKREGYGTRVEKVKNRQVRYKTVPVVRGQAPQAEYTPERKAAPCVLSEDAQPVMSKILANTYAKEWNTVRDKWQESEHWEPASEDVPVGGKIRLETETQSQFHRQKSNTRKTQYDGLSSAGSKKSNKEPEKTLKQREVQKEKELFKMSRFKNIQARTNTNNQHGVSPPWRTEEIAT